MQDQLRSSWYHSDNSEGVYRMLSKQGVLPYRLVLGSRHRDNPNIGCGKQQEERRMKSPTDRPGKQAATREGTKWIAILGCG